MWLHKFHDQELHVQLRPRSAGQVVEESSDFPPT